MAKSFTRQDFLIKDLAVSIGGGGRGGTWLPGPDDETPPSPISPIASVVTATDVKTGLFHRPRNARRRSCSISLPRRDWTTEGLDG